MNYLFAGNRGFVLQRMRDRGLPLAAIYAVEGSFLERELDREGVPFETLPPKGAFVERLARTDFDVFVSNGCPHILPIERLSESGTKRFVNVHPSPLPELRGADPVPGALLLGKDSGASCHLMDDGIDTGPLIARVTIPMTDELDAGLLYQLSFLAEVEAFEQALGRDFRPDEALSVTSPREGCYYTFAPEDLRLDLSRSEAEIVRQVRAFSSRSKGVWFEHRGERLRAFSADVLTHPTVLAYAKDAQENQIVFRYEQALILRRKECCLRLDRLEGEVGVLCVGDTLSA